MLIGEGLTLNLIIQNLMILFDLDQSSRAAMLMTISIFAKNEWNKWKSNVIEHYHQLQLNDAMNQYQIEGKSYLKLNQLDYIIQPDRVHGDQVLKRIAKKLAKHERIPFLREGLPIRYAKSLDEGMKLVNKFYIRWHKHHSVYIRTKMELFRQPHWLRHSYSWAKNSSSTTSMFP